MWQKRRREKGKNFQNKGQHREHHKKKKEWKYINLFFALIIQNQKG